MHAVVTLSWSLMCRASNGVPICLNHLSWTEDALCVMFAHMKNDQTASKPREPRHVDANPLNPSICPILSLALYLACFARIESNCESASASLFPGHSQYARYSTCLKAHFNSISILINCPLFLFLFRLKIMTRKKENIVEK